MHPVINKLERTERPVIRTEICITARLEDRIMNLYRIRRQGVIPTIINAIARSRCVVSSRNSLYIVGYSGITNIYRSNLIPIASIARRLLSTCRIIRNNTIPVSCRWVLCIRNEIHWVCRISIGLKRSRNTDLNPVLILSWRHVVRLCLETNIYAWLNCQGDRIRNNHIAR